MFGEIGIVGLGIVFASVLIAMTTHEAMHGFTAHWLGDSTADEAGRLTLNPLKHIDIFTTVLLPVVLIALQLPPFFVAKPVPFNPWRVKYAEFGAALIGLAGPLTNLGLAVIVAMFMRLAGVGVGTDVFAILSVFVQINIALFVFNMVPFPPLDGSRVLYAVAPEPLQRFMRQIESFGLGAIFIFMFLLFPVLAPVVIGANEYIYNILL